MTVKARGYRKEEKPKRGRKGEDLGSTTFLMQIWRGSKSRYSGSQFFGSRTTLGQGKGGGTKKAAKCFKK